MPQRQNGDGEDTQHEWIQQDQLNRSQYGTYMQGIEDKGDQDSDGWTCLELVQIYNGQKIEKQESGKN